MTCNHSYRSLLPIASRRVAAGLACLLGIVPGSSGQAAPHAGRAVPSVDDFVHDGTVSEWRARPVDRILEAGPGRPQALTWLGQVPEGLVVAVEVRAGSPADVEAAIDVLLSGPSPPRLPPIGWGHQFGIEVIADSTGCGNLQYGSDDPAACRRWLDEQEEFRATLPRLFERVWRLPLHGGQPVAEVHAKVSFDGLDPSSRVAWSALAPRGAPRVLSRPIAGTAGGVGFELLVPWSAFPPVEAPDLEAIRLEVRWADPPARDGEPFAEVTPRPLAEPLRHAVTPCRFGLAGILIPGAEAQSPRAASEDAVAYMVPEASGDLRSLIVLDHPVTGYQYDPDPEARSPSAFETRYGVLDVGRGERLCVPTLALAVEGGRLSPPGWTRTGEGNGAFESVDLRHLEVRRLEDGDLLALQRPRAFYSYYGSGQCGACPRVGVDLFHISTSTGVVTPLIRVIEIAENEASDVLLDVSEDWSRVTVYRSSTDWSFEPPRVAWTARHLCRDERDMTAQYDECGVEDVADPPDRLRALYRGIP